MTQEEIIERFVCSPCRVAVVGASPKADRPVYAVGSYLVQHGFAVMPVNPAYAGVVLFGHSCHAYLGDVDPVPQVVAFFLASERQADALRALRTLPEKPVVWFQPGAENRMAEEALRQEGYDVVSNACMMMVHQVYCGA